MYRIEYKGKIYPSIKALARALNMPYTRLKHRIDQGYPKYRWEEPVSPGGYRKPVTYKGVLYNSYKDLTEDLGINYQQFINRLHRKWPLEDAIELPFGSRSQDAVEARIFTEDKPKRRAIGIEYHNKLAREPEYFRENNPTDPGADLPDLDDFLDPEEDDLADIPD